MILAFTAAILTLDANDAKYCLFFSQVQWKLVIF